jgi:ATP-dependent Clp endopeptidase proteolytic subunit ClpP
MNAKPTQIFANAARPAPANPRPWFSVTASANQDEPVQLMIYDQIGRDWFDQSGVSAADFARELSAIPMNREIVVSINSPGGNVFDGLAIYHQLAARRNKVVVRVDGTAASIASIIALAGRELRIPSNAWMMIHDPSGVVIGTAEEMKSMASLLDQHADNLADIYAQHTGKSKATIRQAMRDETWFTGAEAVAYGLASHIDSETRIAASFDFSGFRRVPDSLRTTANINQPATSGAGKPPHTMNRAQMIAALRARGIQVADDATDKWLSDQIANLNQNPAQPATPPAQPQAAAPSAPATPSPATPAPAVPTTPQAGSDPRILALEASLARERSSRITARLDALCAQNPSIDRAAWLPRVLADETIIDQLATLPGSTAAPVGRSITNNGNPMLETYRTMRAGADRLNYRISNWDALETVHRQFGPQNANTLGSSLVPDTLADQVIVVANNKLAPLTAFSRDFGANPIRPRSTVQVAKATAGASTQTNATNFESGDSTLTNVGVTVNQLTQSFHLTNDQINKGFVMAQLAGINADVFCNAISDVWTALCIAGNYGAATVIGTAANFDPSDLPPIFELAKNYRRRNLVLDGGHLARLFPGVIASFSSGVGLAIASGGQVAFPGVFGFDGLFMQNRWTSAVANCVGFVCSPDAIAVASGIPIGTPNGEFMSQQIVTIDSASPSNNPGLGLSVQVCTWWSRSTRTMWASYDVMFGAAAGDTTQAENLVTA